jgi:hypothetical protein
MCQPEKVEPTILTGKLVTVKGCGILIEVLKGSIDPTKLDPLWKDPTTGIIYFNVFTVDNQCTFPGGFADGDIITFQLDYNPPPPGPLCDMCAISSPVPPVGNTVKDVKKVN